jgi:hypothetical protein
VKRLAFSAEAMRSKEPLKWDYCIGKSRGAVFFRCPKGHLNVISSPPYKISTTAKAVGTVYPKVKCSNNKCNFVDVIILDKWGQ